MNTIRILLLLVACALARSGSAQLKFSASKPLTAQSASMLVNKSYAGDSYIVEKSTVQLNKPIAEMMRRYDKTIIISYQIASVNALEWIQIRSRAADVLDTHFWTVLSRGLLAPVMTLQNDAYVPLSTYAPMTLKLNFNFGKAQPYYHGPEDFARTNAGTPIHTKSMLIKK